MMDSGFWQIVQGVTTGFIMNKEYLRRTHFNMLLFGILTPIPCAIVALFVIGEVGLTQAVQNETFLTALALGILAPVISYVARVVIDLFISS